MAAVTRPAASTASPTHSSQSGVLHPPPPSVRDGSGAAASGVLAASIGGLAPPHSPTGWLAAMLAVAIPIGVVASGQAAWWTKRRVQGVLLALLLAAAANYGWARSAYVIDGENGAQLVRGTDCTADARLVYESDCPDLPSDAIADAAYDAAALWTAASIGRVKLFLGALWVLSASAAALLVAGWLGGPRRLKQEA